jgi:hypothetical protein
MGMMSANGNHDDYIKNCMKGKGYLPTPQTIATNGADYPRL